MATRRSPAIATSDCTAGRQPPHRVAAPQRSWTSATLHAPASISASTRRSDTRRQWQISAIGVRLAEHYAITQPGDSRTARHEDTVTAGQVRPHLNTDETGRPGQRGDPFTLVRAYFDDQDPVRTEPPRRSRHEHPDGRQPVRPGEDGLGRLPPL